MSGSASCVNSILSINGPLPGMGAHDEMVSSRADYATIWAINLFFVHRIAGMILIPADEKSSIYYHSYQGESLYEFSYC